MSLFRSILQGRPLQRWDSELPMYRTYQEPEAFPPAPIAASIHVPKAETTERPPLETPQSQDLVMLQRRSKHYISRLQEYVDAQSEGLVAGLDGHADDEDSLETPTQTTYSLRSLSVSPSRQPRRKIIGLRQARRGIWRTLNDCAAIKDEEDAVLKEEVRSRQGVKQQLDQWSSKEDALKAKIDKIEHDDVGARTSGLKEEAARMGAEIQELEVRLAQMKTRHRQILNQVAEAENSVQSKLSSYKSSLDMLRKDVNQFLRSPPITEDSLGHKSTFVALPANRRTLEMAREHWQFEVATLKAQRKRARLDRNALAEGAVLWQAAVAEITDYERFLREEIGKLSSERPSAKGKARAETSAGPEAILDRLDLLLRSIEEKLALAHEKGWQLLTTCLDAELQALRSGKLILEQTFQITPKDDQRADLEDEKQTSTQESSTRDLFASAHEGLSDGGTSATHSAALRKSMHEDDDPDPELLFARPEEDTE